MKWQDLIIDGYGRVLEALVPALKGLSQGELDRQPKADCNSIGWIAWHLTRGQDAQIADLMGEEQIWVKDKWYLKFNRPVDAEDTGYRHTTAQVAAFKSPAPRVLVDYYRGTLEQSKRYISALSLAELDRQLDEPWFKPIPTVGVRVVSIMADGLQHSGEIEYLRGLIKSRK